MLKLEIHSVFLFSYLGCKVLALVQVFKAQSIVSNELDVLILGNISLSVVSEIIQK